MISAADVEAELLRRSRSKRTSVQNALLLLVSVAAFAATGVFRSSWSYVEILVVVLLVHETGHWLAMRHFGYRNLRMFFIPFFGAAVTGDDNQATGERRAIVDLLGPAPGIILGIISGLVYLKWNEPLFLRYAIASVFINGLNLLPIYPLDGGRFMEVVVFSRHPAVEIVFKVLAALALGALAIRLSSISLGLLALFTLLLIREAYFQCKIVMRLKEILGGNTAPAAEQMPMECLQPILPDLGAGLSKSTLTAKVLANRAETVWRRICQRAPRLGPSLVLLGIYVSVFICALVALVMLFAANRALNEKGIITHRVTSDGKTVSFEERYWNQHKISETQLNDRGLYDGPSTRWSAKGVKQSEGFWANGYWRGEWKYYDSSGYIRSVVTYDDTGRPVRYQISQNWELVDVKADDWPASIKNGIQRSPQGPGTSARR
jgi:Zn-dependent protease